MNLKFWLLDVWSRVESGTETAHLVGFNKKNEIIELVDGSVPPFILARANGVDLVERRELYNCSIRDIEKIDGLEKVTFAEISASDATKDIPRLRNMLEEEGIKTAEGDIYYTQVYMKARGFKPCSWHSIHNPIFLYEQEGREVFRITDSSIELLEDDSVPEIRPLALDIEVYTPRGGMPDKKKDPICLFGIKDRDKVVMVEKSDAEEDDYQIIHITETGINKEAKPHVIVTYNGNEFDWPYVADRADEVKASFRVARDKSMPHKTEWNTIAINGRPTIDLFGIAKFVVPKGSRKSQYHVHKELVKAGLVPEREYYGVDRSGTDKEGIDTNLIAKYWDTPEGREKVIKHCTSDVTVTMDIFNYAWPFIVELSRLTNLPPDQVLSVSFTVLIESFLMQIAHKLNVVIPNARYVEVPETTGAVCFEPEKGVLENVAVFDFASMYPNILVEKNIGHETYYESKSYGDLESTEIFHGGYNKVEEEGGKTYIFLKQPKSLFACAMEYLLLRIEEAKKKYGHKKYKQKYAGEVQALKTVARAMYGYFKAKKTRWPSAAAQDAIATEGRNEIRKASKAAGKYGYETIYGDTDSIFLSGFKEEDCKEFAEVLTEEVGADVGFDKFYETIFFTEKKSAKKGEAAKKLYAGLKTDGEIDYVGFTKSDWAPVANKAQMKILEIVLKDKDPYDAKEYVMWLANGIRREVYPLKNFIIWKKIRKEYLEDYRTHAAHIEVAKRNPEAFIEEDGTVGYVIVKGQGKIYQKARHYSEVKSVSELDKSYYINNQLLAVAERILKYFFGNIDMVNRYFKM